MRRKSLFSTAFMLLSMILVFSCKKDITTDSPQPAPGDEFPIPAASLFKGSVSGMVVDENEAPLAGATVNCSGISTVTDANGIFHLNNVNLDKYVSTVTVTNSGYFKGYRSFSANTARNYLTFKLIPKTLSGTVSTTAGGNITLTNGTDIDLPANGIVDKTTGAIYSGTVNVYASYIDPTADDMGARVPGSFMGRDASNMYSLQSTGMVAVELESPSGQPLQLANGQRAAISLPIPSSLLTKAPTTIDTWYLDDKGVWIKDGTATRNGDHYEFEVSHFSFWNCDVPANAIYLTLHVQDQNGNPITNTFVQLHVPNNNTWWATTYGHTDSLGNVSGMVPAGIALELTLMANPYSCNTPLYTQQIGPFTTNSSLTITATLAPTQLLTVTGTATDCAGQPLQSGTAFIYGNYTNIVATIVNGSYSATISHCSSLTTISVYVVDTINSTQGGSGSVPVSGNSVTVPDIQVCGTPLQAAFTLLGSGGQCQQAYYYGSFTVGTPLTNTNLMIMVDVTRVGNYVISTSTENGVWFTGTGTFTTTGIQSVVLPGGGTPSNPGTYTFMLPSGGATGCSINIPFTGTSTNAVYDLGGPGTCPNVFVAGDYFVGVPLTSSQNVTLMVTVTTAGNWNVSTDTINGIIYYGSGVFTTTGVQTIVLYGYGTPLAAGTSTHTLHNAGGSTGCTFTTNTLVNTPADFTLGGSPGNCTGVTVSGSYIAGTALTTQNTVTLMVNVNSTGTYFISTNSTNGINFYTSGTFTNLGTQSVTLRGAGIPVNPGLSTFFPTTGTNSCVFTVTTQ